MGIINSLKNAKVIHICKLSNSTSYRKKYEEYIVEGERLIKSIPDTSIIKQLYVEIDKKDKYSHLLSNIDNDSIFYVDSKVMKKIANTENPSGILAVINNKTEKISIKGDIIVIADRVRDPGNMGTIIRTMAALDITTLIAVNSVSIYSPKVIRSSMGGVFVTNIIETDYLNIEDIKRYNVLTLDMGGEDIFKIEGVKKPVAIVVGNEANGISDEINLIKSGSISLPMSGKIESLNAGVALSVALYQIKHK